MNVTWDNVHESDGYAWGSIETGRVLVLKIHSTGWLAVEKTWDNDESLPAGDNLYGVLCPSMKMAMQVVESSYRHRIPLPLSPHSQSPDPATTAPHDQGE